MLMFVTQTGSLSRNSEFRASDLLRHRLQFRISGLPSELLRSVHSSLRVWLTSVVCCCRMTTVIVQSSCQLWRKNLLIIKKSAKLWLQHWTPRMRLTFRLGARVSFA
jgi:hypothetical protein